MNSKEIMDGIKQGEYKKLDEKVYEIYEKNIFSQNSVSIKKAKKYVEILKSLNSLGTQPQQNITNTSRSMQNIRLKNKDLLNISISVLEEEIKSSESGNNKNKNSNSGSSGESQKAIKQSFQKAQNSEIQKTHNSSLIQQNLSELSDSYIPKETDKQAEYDNLEKKWLEFNTQRNLKKQDKFLTIIKNEQNSQNKVRVDVQPSFDNIFSNPSERSIRNQGRQSTLHLLSPQAQNTNSQKNKKTSIILNSPQFSSQTINKLLSFESQSYLPEIIEKNQEKSDNNQRFSQSFQQSSNDTEKQIPSEKESYFTNDTPQINSNKINNLNHNNQQQSQQTYHISQNDNNNYSLYNYNISNNNQNIQINPQNQQNSKITNNYNNSNSNFNFNLNSQVFSQMQLRKTTHSSYNFKLSTIQKSKITDNNNNSNTNNNIINQSKQT